MDESEAEAVAALFEEAHEAVRERDRLTGLADEQTARFRRAVRALHFRYKQTYPEIGAELGVTPSRVGQIIGAPPERLLLASTRRAPVRIAVVEKRGEATLGASQVPQIAMPTQQAVTKLRGHAASLQLDVGPELTVPEDGRGMIDLNQDNLVVLIGPRISVLIEAMLRAAPVIEWRKGADGFWYIVDTRTGVEYRSEFDVPADRRDGVRTCVAHIGKIPRPDGKGGGVLYLGGVHAPGTAGAVEAFIENMRAIWDKAGKGSWSAIVTTKADANGRLIEADLATPIYTHESR